MQSPRLTALAAATLVLVMPGCIMHDMDPGPEKTEQESVEAGTAEAVRAEIRMGAGELKIKGGSAKLLEANFRYSERVGRPEVRYELTGFRGRLTVEGPKQRVTGGNVVNEWNLTLGAKVPLDLHLQMGAGKSQTDLSTVPVRNVEIQMGAGECELNMAGNYGRDVTVSIQGGVGTASIKLPKSFGAVVEAKGGLGSVEVEGLEKRDGKYYNSSYGEGKPAIRMKVQGGIGEIRLSVVD